MKRYHHQISKRKNVIAVVIFCVVIVLLIIGARQLQQQFEKKYQVNTDNASATQTQTDASQAWEPTMELILGDGIYGSDHKIDTYLFMGTDLSGNEQGKEEEYRGTMADFLCLAIADHTDQSYACLELNRDTMTKVILLQANGGHGASATLQLCTAHWYGGNRKASCKNTVQAVSDLFGGLPIKGYYELNMKAIPIINHRIGGVEVTIEDDFSQSDPSLAMGETITLSDEQAYHFLHDRMNVGDGENTSRMRRQQTYLHGMIKKVQSMQENDHQFVINMLQDISEYSVSSMDLNKMGKVIQKLQGYTYEGMYTIAGQTRLGQALGDGLDHTEFYMDEKDRLQKLTEIYHLQKIADYEGEEELQE